MVDSNDASFAGSIAPVLEIDKKLDVARSLIQEKLILTPFGGDSLVVALALAALAYLNR